MENDQKFWISITSIICICFIMFVMCVTISSIHTNKMIAKTIYAGTDPVEASVAFRCNNESTKIVSMLKK